MNGMPTYAWHSRLIGCRPLLHRVKENKRAEPSRAERDQRARPRTGLRVNGAASDDDGTRTPRLVRGRDTVTERDIGIRWAVGRACDDDDDDDADDAECCRA
ncbi:PREDICTED: uncharacterized protein LOC105561203 [Vollenhovia emeryi]|uniref:uncharacterized protein LOC105561203 n=1 Tax=Vollenhovia emeryi TaxID=411798 RepID=UPI0005F3B28A|nr:PREDICTED: uncharacterized protein LOC105561203 [Vollenhovia emeryi]